MAVSVYRGLAVLIAMDAKLHDIPSTSFMDMKIIAIKVVSVGTS